MAESHKRTTMKVRHILVSHQYEAEDVLRLLRQGRDFSELAKKFSICSSASQGGYLGDLSGKNIDEEFSFALQKLKSNEISPVVRTRFGYHILQRL